MFCCFLVSLAFPGFVFGFGSLGSLGFCFCWVLLAFGFRWVVLAPGFWIFLAVVGSGWRVLALCCLQSRKEGDLSSRSCLRHFSQKHLWCLGSGCLLWERGLARIGVDGRVAVAVPLGFVWFVCAGLGGDVLEAGIRLGAGARMGVASRVAQLGFVRGGVGWDVVEAGIRSRLGTAAGGGGEGVGFCSDVCVQELAEMRCCRSRN